MPAYEFLGTERIYTEGRDASGRHIGLVQPGDRRVFDDPPGDGLWAEVDFAGESGLSEETIAAHDGQLMTAVEHPADGTWSPEIGGEVPEGSEHEADPENPQAEPGE